MLLGMSASGCRAAAKDSDFFEDKILDTVRNKSYCVSSAYLAVVQIEVEVDDMV